MHLIQKASLLFSKYGLQFSKFLVVGLINTVIGYSIFTLLTFMGNGPSVALLLTYVIAVQINYITTGRLVFSNASFSAFVPFIMAYVVIYCVNLIFLHTLMHWHISQLLAQAILLPFLAPLSFLIFRNSVFRKSRT